MFLLNKNEKKYTYIYIYIEIFQNFLVGAHQESVLLLVVFMFSYKKGQDCTGRNGIVHHAYHLTSSTTKPE